MERKQILAIFSIVLIGSLFLSSYCHKMSPIEGFTLTGKINGLKNGEKVLLRLLLKNGTMTDIDSTEVKDGQFSFEGTVPEGPRYYFLEFRPSPLYGLWLKEISIMIENGDRINLIGNHNIDETPNGNLMEYASITGSSIANDWQRLIAANRFHWVTESQIYSVITSIKNTDECSMRLMKQALEARDEHNKIIYYLARDYQPFNRSLPYFLYNNRKYVGHSAILKNIYEELLSPKDRESYYGKLLKQVAALSINQPFPSFELPTPDGKKISSTEVTSKQKLTIIQFWSSKSQGIEKYQEELNNVYKQYHSKGLDIIDISSDTSAKRWQVAIQDLPWHHASDLKGKNGIIENVYHEFGDNPNSPNITNVIVDNQERIVAWGVSGVELQFYLYKYLYGL